MATIEPYKLASGATRYRVIYRRPDHKQTSKRGFTTKRDAHAFLASVTVAMNRGEYIDPADTRETIDALGEQWLKSHKPMVKPSTYRSLESAWRVHVLPKWGEYRVGAVTPSDVQAWLSAMSLERSPTTVLRAHGVLASILDAAVADRRVARNVARGVTLPRKTGKRRVFLTHEQVQRLADASKHPDLVLFLAYTGLRWGEAAGLRVEHLDMLRRRVEVVENAVTVGGKIEVGTPKTHEQRVVPFPEFLAPMLAKACEGKPRTALVFGDGEQHMRLPNSARGWFTNAVKRVQADEAKARASMTKAERDELPEFPRVTPHDLRHTAAALAVSAGANVKALQRMLGHASAAMTLDVYAGLFDDDLDAVATALDSARTHAVVAKVLPR